MKPTTTTVNSVGRLALPALVLLSGAGLLVLVLDAPGPPLPPPTADVAVVSPMPAPCSPVSGPPVATPTGAMQVEATVTPDGRLCSVRAISVPARYPRSVTINSRAIPLLNDAAVAARGTDFDGVSGATFTSAAYRQSLQAILDGAG